MTSFLLSCVSFWLLQHLMDQSVLFPLQLHLHIAISCCALLSVLLFYKPIVTQKNQIEYSQNKPNFISYFYILALVVCIIFYYKMKFDNKLFCI